MDRTQHKTNNGVLAAPPGVSHEQCVPISVTHVEFSDGQKGKLTYWKPTTRELELLNKGAAVRLCVLGTSHPMVNLGVEGDGFGDIGGVPL